MSDHQQKPTSTTGAHSGGDIQAINMLKKDEEENLPKDSVPVYVKVTLGVLSVINLILFILVVMVMATVFGSVAELEKPANCSQLCSGVVVVHKVPESVEVPPAGGVQGAAGVGEGTVYPGAGDGRRRPLVAAHLYMNNTRLKHDRDAMRPRTLSSRKRISSCQLGYEVRHRYAGGLVWGVLFNGSTARLQVADSGFYYVYSQVVFDKVPDRKEGQPFSDSLFHVLCKSQGDTGRQDRDLLQATETPNKAHCDVTSGDCTAFHTSHVAGIVRLDTGDEVYVKVSDLRIVHLMGNAKHSFYGLHKI